MTELNVKFNLKKDADDERDLKFKAMMLAANVPASVDLSPFFIPVLNQQNFGTCTAHSMTYAITYILNRMHNTTEFKTIPSRMFMYANARIMDGSPITEDSGASLRNMYKAFAQNFACDETQYPYVSRNLTKKPESTVYAQAKTGHKLFQYLSIPRDENSIKSCLASGYPISFGAEIYSSFTSAHTLSTGVVPIPAPNEQLLGGHAMIIAGYRDDIKMFLVCNSWGQNWGLPNKRGYFHIPFSYILSDKCWDFWSPRMFY